MAGLLSLAGGLAILTAVSPNSTFAEVALPGSLVAAVGMSLAYIPAMLTSMAHAAPSEAGLASGIVNTTYQVGSALGLAAMTAVATSAGANTVGDPVALTDGYSAAFAGAAAIALVAAVVAAVFVARRASAAPTVGARRPADPRQLSRISRTRSIHHSPTPNPHRSIMNIIQTYDVVGMTCDHCARRSATRSASIDGVDAVDVDLVTGVVTVTSSGDLAAADVASAVTEAGYALAG